MRNKLVQSLVVVTILVVGVAAGVAAQQQGGAPPPPPSKFKLTSSAYAEGSMIPDAIFLRPIPTALPRPFPGAIRRLALPALL